MTTCLISPDPSARSAALWVRITPHLQESQCYGAFANESVRTDYQTVGAGRVADLGPGRQTVGLSSIAFDGLQLRENPRPTLLGDNLHRLGIGAAQMFDRLEEHAETPVPEESLPDFDNLVRRR